MSLVADRIEPVGGFLQRTAFDPDDTARGLAPAGDGVRRTIGRRERLEDGQHSLAEPVFVDNRQSSRAPSRTSAWLAIVRLVVDVRPP